jgi:hypothetical protein
MVLTRQEKENEILQLHNQGKTYKEIAEIVRVSPRDIKPVLLKAEKEREKELGVNFQEGDNCGTGDRKTQKAYAFSQAYRLFSEGKTPLDVAIELSLKEPEVTRYYRQYWKLSQMHSLNIVYEEIGDSIIHIPKIHRKIKAAGMGVDQAINLIKNANNHLPSLEQKYHKLKKDVNLLESRKSVEYKTLNDLHGQIDASEKVLEWLKKSCEEEEAKLDHLESEEISLKRLVKCFKNSNEEYLKIKRIVQNKIIDLLLDAKSILKLALYSLKESMKKDPQKYINLIYYDRSFSAGNNAWQYTGYNYRLRQSYASFNNFDEEYSTLLEDAEKLYNKLVKEWTEQVLKEYSIKNGSTHNKLLSADEERQQHYEPSIGLSLPLAISDNQAVHAIGVNRVFVGTEF